MKKTVFFQQLIFLIFSALWIMASVSCRSGTGGTITEFLEQGKKEIRILGVDYNIPVLIDKDGYTCIPSSGDIDISFFIQNPEEKKLDYNLATLLDVEMYEVRDEALKWLTPAEMSIYNYNDKERLFPQSRVLYTLGQELLYKLEKTEGPGSDFNPRLGINAANYNYHPVPGSFYTDEELTALQTKWNDYKTQWASLHPGASQEQLDALDAKDPENFDVNIELFNTKVRINSPPPYVQGACIMVDSSTKILNNTDGNYVICFNLPDSIFMENGIHRDVKKLYVTGLESQFGRLLSEGIDLNINFRDGTITNTLTKEKGNSGNLVKISQNNGFYNDGMPAVEFNPGKHAIYIWDDAHYSIRDPDQTYTITLEDEKGLTSTVTLNTRYLRLEPPYARSGTKEFAQGECQLLFEQDSYGNNTKTYSVFNLIAPDKCVGTAVSKVKDVEIHYEIFSLNLKLDPENSKKVFSDSANYQIGKALNSKPILMVDETLYEVTAYARKDGYLDSELAHWSVTSGNWRYVDVEVIPRGGEYGADFSLSKDKIIVFVKKENEGGKEKITRYFDDGELSVKVKLYDYLHPTDPVVYLDDEKAAELIDTISLTIMDRGRPTGMYTKIDNTNHKVYKGELIEVEKEMHREYTDENGHEFKETWKEKKLEHSVKEYPAADDSCIATVKLADYLKYVDDADLKSQQFSAVVEFTLKSDPDNVYTDPGHVIKVEEKVINL